MALSPGYGETPLPHDELDALLPEIVEVLDSPITRADVYDVEQGHLLSVGAYRRLDASAAGHRGATPRPRRIHPFVDGNGRTTRLLADLVFAAAQDPTIEQYD
ncbi:Fic family protein [Mycolicibacterium hodleri]|uniref:Fic family protein n=1 Tax=Mycolicibacterium hodleri TaxID=49897 RepID=UPI0021F261D8|nr:Fic family protein [Mycolicibacterium hodleri]